MGQTLGICARRYPSLKSNAVEIMESFEATYPYKTRSLDRRTEAAFEKNYPGQGKQARDEHELQETFPAASAAEAYSKTKCEHYLYGVQITVRTNDWEQVMAPIDNAFSESRARVPRCN